MTATNIDFFADFHAIIAGERIETAARMPVFNPATGEVLALAPDCSAVQLELAVQAAGRSFAAWREKSADARSAVLNSIADRIADHVDPMALLLTREQGKPLSDARMEIETAASWFRHFAAARLPVTKRRDLHGRTAEIRHISLGVVGAIAPWNFPVQLAAWKLAPALITGNTVVLKPSPYTPLTTLKLVELVRDLLPPGVLNVVCGGDHLGPMMSTHAAIDKIAFTGSTATGKAVMRSAAGNLKRLTLELGGNDAAIVLPDVNVDMVAQKLFWGAFRNAGQICVAAKRIYVHDAIYDRFAARMVQMAHEHRPQSGEAPGARIGPVQNLAQYRRVLALIEQARADGLRFLTTARDPHECGYFIDPTIIDNPPPDSAIVREEPFGPVVPLLRYTDITDAIAQANDSEYGLAASVWSSDEEAATEIGKSLEVGTVWINTIHGLTPDLPFGGHKQSGFGVENAEEGLLEYTNMQVVVV